MYSTKKCVLKSFKKLSDIFETHGGIKQGASSSVILFIAFMDNIIGILTERCTEEPVLKNVHCLLHADDTLILSTNRNLFETTCHLIIEAFYAKKMSINTKKSGYMIINGKDEDVKSDIKLSAQWIPYKSEKKYLGAIFTDTGIVREDVNLFVKEKSKDVMVKLSNFIYNNKYAPVTVKLKVVKACVNASITYSCESWGSCALNTIESLQRKALKIALGVRNNIPNEIIYGESGFVSLRPAIYKRQLTFYTKLKNDKLEQPHSTVAHIFNTAIEKNIHFLRHYKQLDMTFNNPDECYKCYVKSFIDTSVQKVREKGLIENDSSYGLYLCINQNLLSPKMYREILCFETERLTITRYRTGSHNLKIQTGRHNNIAREMRTCICQASIQTLEHVLCSCSLTLELRQRRGFQNKSVGEIMNENDYGRLALMLRDIENKLHLTR